MAYHKVRYYIATKWMNYSYKPTTWLSLNTVDQKKKVAEDWLTKYNFYKAKHAKLNSIP